MPRREHTLITRRGLREGPGLLGRGRLSAAQCPKGPPMSSRLARTSTIAALVAGSAAVFAPVSAVAATPGTGPAPAAHYLAAQLAAGGHLASTTYDGKANPDAGLTADSILALNALGTGGSETAAATSAFAGTLSSYTGTGAEHYVGATAKALVVAVANGRNPASFGGIDLVAQLKGLETASGRFSDKSTYGDYSNGITQALAVIAQKRAGSTPDAKAVNYLLSQQCANGGFAMTLGGASCSADPDATSFMVQALTAVGGHSAAVAKADAYLRSAQGADGGVRGGTGTSAENSNSTGLAAVAFTLAGDRTAAAKATSFVNSLQYGCAAPAALRGAVAYNKADFTSQSALGAKATSLGNEMRATAQAALAFAPVSYASVADHGSADVPAISCGTATSTPTTAPAPVKTSTGTTTVAPTKTPSTTTAAPTKPMSPTTTAAPTKASTGTTATAPTKSSTPVATPTSTTASATSTATAVPSSSGTASSVSSSATASSVVATPSKSTTGPKVDTDDMSGSSSDELAMTLAGAAVVLAGGGAFAFARRR